MREIEIKRKNSVREMKIKISDTRICVIKIVEKLECWRAKVGKEDQESERE